jgi:hemolysin III
MYYGEKLNSITHLVGAVLALIGFGALLTLSIQQSDPLLVTGFVIFGVTLVLLYTMSTLYHSFKPPGLKKVFRVLDHVTIYLLIAGTYTPYLLVSLDQDGMLLMLIFIWSLALAGILLDTLIKKRIIWLQVMIYLIMGWVCVLSYSQLEAIFPEAGLAWLLAGGIAYTSGVLFYVLDKLRKLRHAHGIWHLFVLVGSICHFVSIAGYIR